MGGSASGWQKIEFMYLMRIDDSDIVHIVQAETMKQLVDETRKGLGAHFFSSSKPILESVYLQFRIREEV